MRLHILRFLAVYALLRPRPHPVAAHRLQEDTLPAPNFTLSVTLVDGTKHTFKVATVPPAWKSWVMRQLPYGTSFQGATFTRRLN
jgi:hypothetical protein